MKRISMRVVFFAFMLPAIATFAGENARLPYIMVSEMQEVQARLSKTYTNVHVFTELSSRSPAVKASDLQVYIDSKSGKLPVQLEKGGRFVVPLREDLRQENPFLVCNQPKGSMQLRWSFALKFPGLQDHGPKQSPAPVRYRTLMQGLKDLEPIQQEMHRVFPGAPKLTIAGLKLIFSGQNEATVLIRAKSGTRSLKTVKGEVIVPLEGGLFEENPEVILPATPTKMDVAGRRDDA